LSLKRKNYTIFLRLRILSVLYKIGAYLKKIAEKKNEIAKNNNGMAGGFKLVARHGIINK